LRAGSYREMSRVGSEGISNPLDVFSWRPQASEAVPKARGPSHSENERNVDMACRNWALLIAIAHWGQSSRARVFVIAGLLNEYKPARANHKAANHLTELKRGLVSPGKAVRGFTAITKPPPGRFISTKRRSRACQGFFRSF
jgi:hypothetical protein